MINSEELPSKTGVYVFYDKEKRGLYVGKARNIRARVSSHFKAQDFREKILISKVKKVETIETETELEALLLEAELIKRLKPPYNVVAKDDKSFLFIKITLGEDFPRVLLVRKKELEVRKDSKSRYFGPFPSAKTTRSVLKVLRKIFPYCSQGPPEKKKRRACLYYHLGLCPGVCRGDLDKSSYRSIIQGMLLFLSGKKKNVIKDLEKKMREEAGKENFEEAQKIKGDLEKLYYITSQFRFPDEYLTEPKLLERERYKILQELSNLLDLKEIPHRIEAYDISNLQGKHATGAMVVFTEGRPDQSSYRRFRIKFKHTPDDPEMLREVLRRRFKHKEWPKPNLILIDGGKAQVSASKGVLEGQLGLKIPFFGLAKRLEEIITSKLEIIRLPKDSETLKFLQRVRDEAHRFALSYHRLLRERVLFP